eukprot:205950-Pyramimonas_sp.AAC.1
MRRAARRGSAPGAERGRTGRPALRRGRQRRQPRRLSEEEGDEVAEIQHVAELVDHQVRVRAVLQLLRVLEHRLNL